MDGYAKVARERGWTESPEGWWWREIEEGETIVNGCRVRNFMGSGPFFFADDAEDCLVADGVLT